MKYRTVTEKVGELLGPVDWDYDFKKHYQGHAVSASKRKQCEKDIETLRLLAENPGEYEATTYGGMPRCGWGHVIAVGMYDGWPHWKPVPSVCIQGVLGPEWASFNRVTDIREVL